jgi:hypothetical protein
VIVCGANPTARTHSGCSDARTRDSASAHDSPARGVTARTNYRGSAHGASASHGGAATSCADLDGRAILLELILYRAIGAGESRGLRHRKAGQTDGDRTGHSAESLRCAATLTNERHYRRLHFRTLSMLPTASLRRAAGYRSAPLPQLDNVRTKLFLSPLAVNLKLIASRGRLRPIECIGGSGMGLFR